MPSRREVLATTGSSLAALAGCATDPSGSSNERSPPVDSPDGADGGDRPAGTPRSPEALDIGGSDADRQALDAADGTEHWSRGFPDTVVEGDIVRSGLAAQPTVVEGAVYADAADGLYALGPS